MPAGDFALYNTGLLGIIDGSIDLDAASITAVLLADTYTPSAAHSTYADISANVITDADYAPQAVTGVTVTQAGGTVTVDAGDISFGSNVTLTAKYVALVLGTAGADKLVGYADLNSGGGSVSSTASTFAVNINASGLFTVS